MYVSTDPQKKGEGVRFDPTINLGHLITFVGFLLAIFAAWTSLDKRVVVLEANQIAQTQRDNHQDYLLNQHSTQIKEALADIKKSIQRLEDKVDLKLEMPR